LTETESSSIEAETATLESLAAPRSKYHLVTNSKELAVAIEQLTTTQGPVAVDAERASGFKYSQRAYLVQLKTEHSDIFLIDPTTDSSLVDSHEFSQLREFLSAREWILHAATQDIPCLEELGLRPKAIFDTELAGRLTGQPRVGLGSLVESLLQIGLAKEHSAADWSTRPLPESWLNYAALDVELLHDLRASLQKLLEAQDKSDWANQEFENLLSFKPKPTKQDRWRGISGLSKVSDQLSLELARQLWLAREKLAIKLDVSPGRLIPDASILAVAIAKPRTRPELASLRTFTGRASRSYLDLWWEALQSALKATVLPPVRAERTEGIPNHRNWAAKYPEADRRLRHAKSALTQICENAKVPLENLLTPDFLRQICFAPPEPATLESVRQALMGLGARRWQVDLTADAITNSITRLDEPDQTPQSPQELL
jgi:ribonuclease D